MSTQTLKHLAVIMDGNGRWAQNRGRPRAYGHIKGTRVAKEIITACVERKLPHLTLYAFSAENWLRPPAEVQFLMRLLGRYLKKERRNLVQQNIRFEVIGELERIPQAIRHEIEASIAETKNNTGLHLVFALSYGSRQEILRATQKLAAQVASGALSPEEITEENFTASLDTGETPAPDLILRTSGEQRISNFLLWQSAYSELYFTETLWPDFKISDLDLALAAYDKRTRRFGQVEAPPSFSLGGMA